MSALGAVLGGSSLCFQIFYFSKKLENLEIIASKVYELAHTFHPSKLWNHLLPTLIKYHLPLALLKMNIFKTISPESCVWIRDTLESINDQLMELMWTFAS